MPPKNLTWSILKTCDHIRQVFSQNYQFNQLSASVAVIETSQLICCASQLTGFYMRATLALNGLSTILKRKMQINTQDEDKTIKTQDEIAEVSLF